MSQHKQLQCVKLFSPRLYSANHLVQQVQDFGYGAQYPAADPPEGVAGVWPRPAPPADLNMPPANILRNLAIHYLSNPDARLNVFRIEPRPGGRSEMWIALDLADNF